MTQTVDPTKPAERESRGMAPKNIIIVVMVVMFVVVLTAAIALQNKANKREADQAQIAAKPDLGQTPSPEEINRISAAQRKRADDEKAIAAKEQDAGVEPSIRVLSGNQASPSLQEYAAGGQTVRANALVQGRTSEGNFLQPPRGGDFAQNATGTGAPGGAPPMGEPSLTSTILVPGAKGGNVGSAVKRAAEQAGLPPQLADAIGNLAPALGANFNPPSPEALASAFQPRPQQTQVEQNQSFLRSAQQPMQAAPALRALRPEAQVILMQGAVLQAVSETAINSDLPGNIRAIVSQDVYDSLGGDELLIPKGSRLVGTYNANVASSQSRILMVFNRLIMPDGRSVDLQGMAGSDPQGRAGVTGDINHHFLRNFGSGFLVAGLTYALGKRDPQVAINVTTSPGQPVSLTSSAGQILAETAKQAMETYKQPRPTITIDGGTPFAILVQRDIVLAALKRHTAPAFDAVARSR